MKLRSGDLPDLISVILTTYDREDALDAALSALSRQNDRGFEVVVADDGSGPATAALVERWRPRLGVALCHVWQPERGFRAAEIRNRALLAARGDYCVFLDGDCIAPTDFVATHRKLAEPGWFVTGNRVLLAPALTAAVLREGLQPETWSLSQWLGHRSRGGVNRLARGAAFAARARCASCRLGNGAARAPAILRSGARISIESTVSTPVSAAGAAKIPICWSACCIAGVRRKDGRFATGVIHLWHGQEDRAQLSANDARLDDGAAQRPHARAARLVAPARRRGW